MRPYATSYYCMRPYASWASTGAKGESGGSLTAVRMEEASIASPQKGRAAPSASVSCEIVLHDKEEAGEKGGEEARGDQKKKKKKEEGGGGRHALGAGGWEVSEAASEGVGAHTTDKADGSRQQRKIVPRMRWSSTAGKPVPARGDESDLISGTHFTCLLVQMYKTEAAKPHSFVPSQPRIHHPAKPRVPHLRNL
jgi:hypothetical protein